MPLHMASDPSWLTSWKTVQRDQSCTNSEVSPAEKTYAQIDKEGLAVIYGLKKFHQCLWGCRFTIVTEHKPLLELFGETKAVPQMLSPRMQRVTDSIQVPYSQQTVPKHSPSRRSQPPSSRWRSETRTCAS